MNGSVLDVTKVEKDLGVWISSDLTWTNQVYHQSNKKISYLVLFVDHQGTSGNLVLAELFTWLLFVRTWVMQPKSGPLNQSN